MSDFSGGFVVARADPRVAEPVYRVVREYLARIGEAPYGGRSVVYATGREVKALWLTVCGGPSNGKGRTYWHEQNAALAGELAKALGCAAWAWGQENQVGSEFAVAFDASGTEIRSRRISWDDVDDDATSPIAEVSATLGSWEGGEGVATTEQLLDADFEPLLLEEYLLALNPPELKSSAERMKFSVFLTQSVLADATKLARATATDLGTVFWAAWELAKTDACRQNPAKDGVALTLPDGEFPVDFVSPRKACPVLSKNDGSTPGTVTMLVPPRVEKEVRALALHADVKYGRVVDYVYRLAREPLWCGRE